MKKVCHNLCHKKNHRQRLLAVADSAVLKDPQFSSLPRQTQMHDTHCNNNTRSMSEGSPT